MSKVWSLVRKLTQKESRSFACVPIAWGWLRQVKTTAQFSDTSTNITPHLMRAQKCKFSTHWRLRFPQLLWRSKNFHPNNARGRPRLWKSLASSCRHFSNVRMKDARVSSPLRTTWSSIFRNARHKAKSSLSRNWNYKSSDCWAATSIIRSHSSGKAFKSWKKNRSSMTWCRHGFWNPKRIDMPGMISFWKRVC